MAYYRPWGTNFEEMGHKTAVILMYHLGSVQSKRISTDIQVDILFVQRNHFPENYEHALRCILENYSRKFFFCLLRLTHL